MSELVIYTCIAGGYDSIKQPLTIYPDVDYVCFCDNVAESRVGVWQIKPIPYPQGDNTLRARYVKHNPHIVVSEYRYSVWIDSNIQIVDRYLLDRVNELISAGSLMAHISHPYRDCIYDEAREIILTSRDSFKNIYRLVRMYREEGFPTHYGLSETNILFREHGECRVKELSEQWWKIILEYSRRDQLSFYYVLWRNKLTVDSLFTEGVDTYSKEHFIRSDHNSTAVGMFKYRLKCFINRQLYKFIYSRVLKIY